MHHPTDRIAPLYKSVLFDSMLLKSTLLNKQILVANDKQFKCRVCSKKI